MPEPPFILIVFSIILLLIAGIVFWFGNRLYGQSGLPRGKVIYADAEEWFEQPKAIKAPEFKLAGKPDYLVRLPSGTIIPVEIKSSRAPSQPYPGHVMQLAAYCLLVWREYKRRPPYGIIQYQDQQFEVDFSRELEADLIGLLKEMQADLSAGILDRNHDNPRRCNSCGVQEYCEQQVGEEWEMPALNL